MRKRKFVVTTDSNHGRKVYPNLARKMILTGTDQLWVADITYIRLRDEFVFLAVILDAHSRRVIGWALDRTLEDELTLGALRMARARRMVEPGLVHHSDRGTQYASTDYTSHPSRPVLEMDESTLLDYVRDQLNEDPQPTPQTINHRLGVLRSLYRFHSGHPLTAGSPR